MPESGMDRLLGDARTSRAVTGVIARAQEQVTAAVLDLDDALALLQDDPDDVGERIKRAMIVRGTLENIVNEAFRVKVERET